MKTNEKPVLLYIPNLGFCTEHVRQPVCSLA